MGRPREFDFDAALERAVQTFWAKGYEATSIDDLCAATGLGRSSLYAAYGDKQAIYAQALERYEQNAVARIGATIANARSVRAGIAAFVQRIIDDIVAGPGRRGCFIGNCAAEIVRGDRSHAARVRRSLERIETTFSEALAKARTNGELSKTVNVAALARFLTAGIQGLRLVGKANPDRKALEDVAAVMLRCFEN
jgi:TetR/AcrR family transcriptional repressor of nem operon